VTVVRVECAEITVSFIITVFLALIQA